MADPIDSVDDVDALIGPQPYRPAAVKVSLDDFALQTHAIARVLFARARLELLSGVHQGFPMSRTPNSQRLNSQAANSQTTVRMGSWKLANEQAFGGSAAWKSMSQQPRGKDLRVVQDEEIAPAQILGDARKGCVFDLSALSIEHE
jgi:hypothetical protein